MTVLVPLPEAVSEYGFVIRRDGEQLMDNDYNPNRYYIEDSDLLTEAEKIEIARSLRELELKGVIEWRHGAWQLVPNVGSEETEEGPVARFRNSKEGAE